MAFRKLTEYTGYDAGGIPVGMTEDDQRMWTPVSPDIGSQEQFLTKIWDQARERETGFPYYWVQPWKTGYTQLSAPVYLTRYFGQGDH